MYSDSFEKKRISKESVKFGWCAKFNSLHDDEVCLLTPFRLHTVELLLLAMWDCGQGRVQTSLLSLVTSEVRAHFFSTVTFVLKGCKSLMC